MILVEFASKTPNQAIQIQLENLSKFCFYIFHQSINSWFSTDNIKGKCEMDYCNILFFVNISRFLFRQKLISSQVVTENCHSCPGEKQYLYCNLSISRFFMGCFSIGFSSAVSSISTSLLVCFSTGLDNSPSRSRTFRYKFLGGFTRLNLY